MKNTITRIAGLGLFLLGTATCTSKQDDMKFIEVTVQNHLVSHGFDENNVEILEEVKVENPSRKLISLDRIQSVSDKYILTTYAHGRLVYWEYEGSYEAIRQKLSE